MTDLDTAPIARAAVSDVVFGRLVDAILSGAYSPGDALPAERELAEAFAVNRHAVREALKRVQQAGLIRISQGETTRVLDWRENAGLDVLSKLTAAGTIPARTVLHDIVVMRRAIATDAAALCALRASEAQIAAITTAATAYEGFEGDVAFWTAVIDGSSNLAYRLGLNTLIAAFSDLGVEAVALLGLSLELTNPRAHQQLAAAIADRNPDKARQLAHDLLTGIVTATAGGTRV